MQIQMPDELKLPARAAAAGFSTVEGYLRDLIERDASESVTESADTGPHRQSLEQWNREFQELLSLAQPRNPSVDDSRESIYGILPIQAAASRSE